MVVSATTVQANNHPGSNSSALSYIYTTTYSPGIGLIMLVFIP